jgi:hypothetical protein
MLLLRASDLNERIGMRRCRHVYVETKALGWVELTKSNAKRLVLSIRNEVREHNHTDAVFTVQLISRSDTEYDLILVDSGPVGE